MNCRDELTFPAHRNDVLITDASLTNAVKLFAQSTTIAG